MKESVRVCRLRGTPLGYHRQLIDRLTHHAQTLGGSAFNGPKDLPETAHSLRQVAMAMVWRNQKTNTGEKPNCATYQWRLVHRIFKQLPLQSQWKEPRWDPFWFVLHSSRDGFALTRSWSGWRGLSAGLSPGNSPVLCPGRLGQALGCGSEYLPTRPTNRKHGCEEKNWAHITVKEGIKTLMVIQKEENQLKYIKNSRAQITRAAEEVCLC